MAIAELAPDRETVARARIPVVERKIKASDLGTHLFDAQTLVLSDLHMGAYNGKSREALKVLKSGKFDELILNGDTYETNYPLRNLSEYDTVFAAAVSQLAQRIPVRAICGNHDDNLAPAALSALGLQEMHDFLLVPYGEEVALIIHGHQGDGSLPKPGSVKEKVGTLAHTVAMRLHMKGLHDRVGNRAVGLNGSVQRNALEFASQHSAQTVICGHTHESRVHSQHGVTYINGGGFAGNVGFVTLSPSEVVLYTVS